MGTSARGGGDPASDASTVVRPSRPGDEAGLRAVMEAVLAAGDGPPGNSVEAIEASLARLPADREGVIVAVEAGTIVGYVAPRAAVLAVHPEHRRRGHGRRLVAAGIALCAARGLPELQLWGDTSRPAAAGFIAAFGFRYRSSLWLYHLRHEVAVPEPVFPATFVTRSFRPGTDEAAYVALLNAAFADYPSPLHWTETTIRHVHGLPGFDPGRILLVAPADDPDRLVGLVVTGRIGPGGAVGEVKFIALLPDWRGNGLGRELLRWAVHRLRAEGANPIELRVEGRNEAALGLYRATGFVPDIEWPQWVLPVEVGRD